MRKSESDLLCQHILFTRTEERTLDGKPFFKGSLCNPQLRHLKRPWCWKASRQSPADSGPQYAGFQTSHLNGVLSQQLSKFSQAWPDNWTIIITLKLNSNGYHLLLHYFRPCLSKSTKTPKRLLSFSLFRTVEHANTETILSRNTASCIS